MAETSATLPGQFPAFLAKCHTLDPAVPQPRPVPLHWPFVRNLGEAMSRHDRLLVVKSRQMMVTWLGCAFLLHRALTSGPGIHVVLSKEERSAKELIERVRSLLEGLPAEWMRGWTVRSVGSAITLTGSQSLPGRIISLPAAPHAVRGLSPRTLFWDEMAFTPNDEAIWSAVKPAVDSGGVFLGVSTPNGPRGVFYRLAHDRSHRFHVHTLRYTDHPDRSSREWQARAKAGLSREQWRREQELSFEGAEGRVYDQFSRETHLLPTRHTITRAEGSRFYRGIDFGYRHPAVVWAEETTDGSLVVFDCLLGNRWSLDMLMEQIRLVDVKHGLLERDFQWSGVDPAGNAVNDYGISPVSTLGEKGYKLTFRSLRVNWGVEKVRSLLLDAAGRIRLRVDPGCEPLIQAFEGYMWNEKGEEPVKDDLHDHLMDALRYLVVNLPRYLRTTPHPGARIAGVSQNR